MSGFTFDSNIIIDAQLDLEPALVELERAARGGEPLWVSRMVWVEVLSKGSPESVESAQAYLSRFSTDELDETIAARAAALRRERPRLKSPDAIILATAQIRGRTLVTRNTRDFPATMPGIRIPYTLPKVAD